MKKSMIGRFFSVIIAFIERVATWVERYRIRVYAAQASFFMTISVIPFLILLITLTGYILPMEDGLIRDAIIQAVPEDLQNVTQNILYEISAKSSFQMLSVSAITLIWSASCGIRALGAGIRNAYCGMHDRNIFKYLLKAISFTLMWMITVITTLGIWVFGDTILTHTESVGLHSLLRLANSGALFVLLTGVFAITYTGYAGTKVNFFSQIKGGAFSAICWFLYSNFFEFYIENLANYSYIYGSLTSIIIVMLWLYACMEIILIGAGINSWFERHGRIRKKEKNKKVLKEDK